MVTLILLSFLIGYFLSSHCFKGLIRGEHYTDGEYYRSFFCYTFAASCFLFCFLGAFKILGVV